MLKSMLIHYGLTKRTAFGKAIKTSIGSKGWKLFHTRTSVLENNELVLEITVNRQCDSVLRRL